jgi:hypothetical protein
LSFPCRVWCMHCRSDTYSDESHAGCGACRRRQGCARPWRRNWWRRRP